MLPTMRPIVVEPVPPPLSSGFKFLIRTVPSPVYPAAETRNFLMGIKSQNHKEMYLHQQAYLLLTN